MLFGRYQEVLMCDLNSADNDITNCPLPAHVTSAVCDVNRAFLQQDVLACFELFVGFAGMFDAVGSWYPKDATSCVVNNSKVLAADRNLAEVLDHVSILEGGLGEKSV